MKSHLLALSVGVVALILMSTSLRAQSTSCGIRDTVVERLASRYGESRQSVGMAANQSVVEVYANSDTGSWTITVTMPNGQMCLIASGMSFEALAEVSPAAMGVPL